MNRTYLLALFLSLGLLASAQSVTLPYNPDVDQDSAIGAGDLLGLLPLFGNYFTPSEVLVDGETLTDYIAALEEAAANATSDTVTLPMLPGTTPGEMLYWDGAQWSMVPTGLSGQALLIDGSTPAWKELKTGCTDSVFLEFDPAATVNDGSCLTPIVLGCTDAQFVEYDPVANVNDGTCATLDTSCSSVEFDGYTYAVVEIGYQCWFAENLRTAVYQNGDSIQYGAGDASWQQACNDDAGVGLRCFMNHDSSLVADFGALYNFCAVTDSRGLCPSGWRVPLESDWGQLELFVASPDSIVHRLKSSPTGMPPWNGSDFYGFAGVPSGARFYSGGFYNFGSWGLFYGDSPNENVWGPPRRLLHDGPHFNGVFDWDRRFGASVRCLKQD